MPWESRGVAPAREEWGGVWGRGSPSSLIHKIFSLRRFYLSQTQLDIWWGHNLPIGGVTSLKKNEYIRGMVPFICIVCSGEFLRDSDIGWVDPDNHKDCICSECWVEVQNTLETDAQLGAIREYLGQSKEERDN